MPSTAVSPGEAIRPVRAGRAPRLTPEARRASVLAAAVPLLLERGLDVSTRDLAQAAGVAEGTLFRVFPDKASLVRAAVGQALDPADLVAQVAAAHCADLRAGLGAAMEAVLDRGRTVSALLAVVHQLPREAAPHPPHPHGPASDGAHPVESVVTAVADLLVPHAARLRSSPQECARLVVSVALGLSRHGGAELTGASLVDLLLDGLLDRTDVDAPSAAAPTSAAEDPDLPPGGSPATDPRPRAHQEPSC